MATAREATISRQPRLGDRSAIPSSGWLFALIFCCLACSRNPNATGSATQELRVSAAASLRDALNAVKAEYEATSGQRLVINFGSSGDLAKQIVAADVGDVFLSADAIEVDRVEKEGRVVAGSRVDLWSNQLVVIEPKPNEGSSHFRDPFTLDQLTGESMRKLALADPRSVPAGRYAKQWLTERGVWDRLESRVVPGVDVRAACALVESGAADAGIVYSTDAAVRDRVRVLHRVPISEGSQIRYVGAAIENGGDGAVEREFLTYLRGTSGQRIFEEFGFLPVPAATSR